MAIVKFLSVFNPDKYKLLKIPRGHLLLNVKESDRDIVKKALMQIKQKQENKGQEIELRVSLSYAYKSRTLDQNALMWALYDIEANEMNAGIRGHKEDTVTPEELYRADIIMNSTHGEVICDDYVIGMLQQTYSINSVEDLGDGRKKMHVWKSSSHFDTKEMTDWINALFNRLAHNGVILEQSNDIVQYWKSWRTHMNKNKINKDEGLMSVKEYKERNPICEACGKYIGAGGGSLAHIKARGMGSNPMETRIDGKDVLHLCDTDHALYDNGIGRDNFYKKYPHLENKIKEALREDFDEENTTDI